MQCYALTEYVMDGMKSAENARTENDVKNLVVCMTRESGLFHLNIVAIRLTPIANFDPQNASSLLNPPVMLPSSTCFSHVLFGLFSFFDLQVLVSSLSSTHDDTNEHCLP